MCLARCIIIFWHLWAYVYFKLNDSWKILLKDDKETKQSILMAFAAFLPLSIYNLEEYNVDNKTQIIFNTLQTFI